MGYYVKCSHCNGRGWVHPTSGTRRKKTHFDIQAPCPICKDGKIPDVVRNRKEREKEQRRRREETFDSSQYYEEDYYEEDHEKEDGCFWAWTKVIFKIWFYLFLLGLLFKILGME